MLQHVPLRHTKRYVFCQFWMSLAVNAGVFLCEVGMFSQCLCGFSPRTPVLSTKYFHFSLKLNSVYFSSIQLNNIFLNVEGRCYKIQQFHLFKYFQLSPCDLDWYLLRDNKKMWLMLLCGSKKLKRYKETWRKMQQKYRMVKEEREEFQREETEKHSEDTQSK